MLLLLRWQAGEISLLQSSAETPSVSAAGDQGEQILLGKVALDFSLSPLTFASPEDRRRLAAALDELRRSSTTWETSAILQIPAIWGITLRLPEFDLPPDEFVDHLTWELSRAILDSVDQYSFHYAFGADNSVRLGALRTRLLDQILQVVGESGFQLLGIQFDDDRFAKVNLLEASAHPKPSLPAPLPQPPPPPPEMGEIEPAVKPTRRRGPQPPWFLAAVIITGLILVTLWSWMKLTSPRKPVARPPAADTMAALPETKQPLADEQPAELAAVDTAKTVPALSDTTAADTKSPAPPVAEAPREITPPEPTPGELAQTVKAANPSWTRMSQRLTALRLFLGEEQNSPSFELISFTGDRFLIQSAGTNPAPWEAALERLKTFPGLREMKAQLASGGNAKGSITAKLVADSTGREASPPQAAAVISLARQHGLKNPPSGGLIFTGARPDMLSFLDDVASRNYAIYRLILVPWGQEQCRAVLEF